MFFADGLSEIHLQSRALSNFSKVFDVLVIGGGINGLGIAWDLSLRGLSVALVERGDFGSETSAGTFRIIHGGFRYLQQFDIKRLLVSAREQQILRQLAPHLVHPLGFLIPCSGLGMKGRPLLACGATVYELLAWFRNNGVFESHKLPRHKILGPEAVRQTAPGLDMEKISGGLVFFDCQVSNIDRLTYEVACAADAAGAVMMNYVEAEKINTQPVQAGRIISSVTVRDCRTGERTEIRAGTVVSAVGPWSSSLLKRLDPPPQLKERKAPRFKKGVQLVFPAMNLPYGVLLESSARHEGDTRVSRGANRSYFLVPWNGLTLAGTAEFETRGEPDQYKVAADEIELFCSELESSYRSESLGVDNIRTVFGGYIPTDHSFPDLQEAVNNEPTALKDDLLFQGGEQGGQLPQNLLVVVGTKYTTFRALSERVGDLVVSKLGKSSECRTAHAKLPYSVGYELERYVKEQCTRAHGILTETVIRRLVRNYGSGTEELLELIQRKPKLAEPIPGAEEILKAEVVYAANSKFAVSLADIVCRRVPFLSSTKFSESILQATAEIVRTHAEWDETTLRSELAITRRTLNYTAPSY